MYGASLRFLIATLLLLLIVRARKQSLRLPQGPKQHVALLIAGLVNGLGYACIYVSELTLSGGTAAVICAASPLFTLLVARMFGLEQLLLRRVFGMSLGLLGIGALFWEGQTPGTTQVHAMLFALTASAVMWPIYGALLKRYAGNLSPLVSTLYFLLYTALTLLVLAPLRGEALPHIAAASAQAHLALSAGSLPSAEQVTALINAAHARYRGNDGGAVGAVRWRRGVGEGVIETGGILAISHPRKRIVVIRGKHCCHR